MKILAIILIFLIALLSGIYPFFKRVTQKSFNFQAGEALACGIFLGAGLLHMLADAGRSFAVLGYTYPFSFLLAGLTFLILLLLEHTGREIYEHQGEASPGFAVLACLMLSTHSFLEGAALGLSASFSVFLVIFLAILAHKWAASFALAVQITKTSLSIRSGLLLFLMFAVMTPLGIAVGSCVSQGIQAASLPTAVFSALAAGTFLYLGTLHGLSRSIMVDRCCNLANYLFVMVGFAIMAIVAIWT